MRLIDFSIIKNCCSHLIHPINIYYHFSIHQEICHKSTYDEHDYDISTQAIFHLPFMKISQTCYFENDYGAHDLDRERLPTS